MRAPLQHLQFHGKYTNSPLLRPKICWKGGKSWKNGKRKIRRREKQAKATFLFQSASADKHRRYVMAQIMRLIVGKLNAFHVSNEALLTKVSRSRPSPPSPPTAKHKNTKPKKTIFTIFHRPSTLYALTLSSTIVFSSTHGQKRVAEHLYGRVWNWKINLLRHDSMC